jgi:hypothetical protein
MTVPLGFVLEDDWGEYFNLPAFLPVSALFSADNTMGVARVSSSEWVRSRYIAGSYSCFPLCYLALTRTFLLNSITYERENGI